MKLSVLLFTVLFLCGIVVANACVLGLYHPDLTQLAAHVGWTAIVIGFACLCFGTAHHDRGE